MLTRLLTAIRPSPPGAMASDNAPQSHCGNSPDSDSFTWLSGDFSRRDETVRRFRRLAESCTDGLTALAYAQFADLLESQPRPAPASATLPNPAAQIVSRTLSVS
jgi:hypothetical protein